MVKKNLFTVYSTLYGRVMTLNSLNESSAAGSGEAEIERAETFDQLRQRLRTAFPTLSPHLQRIARAALEEPNDFALNTTAVIAGRLDVQPSTLIRFAKQFGYSGFSGLQRVFRQRLIEGTASTRETVYAEAEARANPRDMAEILAASARANRAAIDRLEQEMDTKRLAAAVDVISSARHVYVAGLRRSRPIADYLVYGLLRSERASSLLDFSGGMAGPQTATLGADDLLVAIAFPPYSQPVVEAVMDAHVSGRRILAITDGPESPLAAHSNIALLIGADIDAEMQPIAGATALVQTILTALGQA
ncbi:MAG: MurR/RpiR family transcriptional regulator [Pseudomonadota bacterium]